MSAGVPGPLAPRPFRPAFVAASGPLPLEAAREPGHDPPNGPREEHGPGLPRKPTRRGPFRKLARMASLSPRDQIPDGRSTQARVRMVSSR